MRRTPRWPWPSPCCGRDALATAARPFNDRRPCLMRLHERIDIQPRSERTFITVGPATNETTNTTWAVFDASTAATVAGTTWPPTSTVKSSTSVVNTLSFRKPRPPLGHLHASRSPRPAVPPRSPTNPGQEGLGEEASCRRPTGTSSPCRGSPTSVATSNSTNSTPSLTRSEEEWSGATTASRNRSTTARGRWRSSGPSLLHRRRRMGQHRGVQLLAPNPKRWRANQR